MQFFLVFFLRGFECDGWLVVGLWFCVCVCVCVYGFFITSNLDGWGLGMGMGEGMNGAG